MNSKTNKIFVLNLRGNIIGDSIKESALVKFLSEKYPRHKIIMNGASAINQLYKNNSLINEFFEIKYLNTLSKDTFKLRKIIDYIKAYFTLLKNIKPVKGDICVITSKHKFPAIIIPIIKRTKILYKNNLDYFSYQSEMFFSKKELTHANKITNKINKPLVAINIESKDPKRCWNIQKYKVLISKLIQNKFSVILLGTNTKYNQPIINQFNKQIITFVGKTNIRQTAAIIKNCDVYIGNDSGLTHLSGAVKTNSITILLNTDTQILSDKKTKSIKLRNPKVKTIIELVKEWNTK